MFFSFDFLKSLEARYFDKSAIVRKVTGAVSVQVPKVPIGMEKYTFLDNWDGHLEGFCFVFFCHEHFSKKLGMKAPGVVTRRQLLPGSCS